MDQWTTETRLPNWYAFQESCVNLLTVRRVERLQAGVKLHYIDGATETFTGSKHYDAIKAQLGL